MGEFGCDSNVPSESLSLRVHGKRSRGENAPGEVRTVQARFPAKRNTRNARKANRFTLVVERVMTW